MDSLGKTEATTRCGSRQPLPELYVSRDGCERCKREQQRWRYENALFLLGGTNGDSELITQKGEVQVSSAGLRNDIERRFQALLGLETQPIESRLGACRVYRLAYCVARSFGGGCPAEQFSTRSDSHLAVGGPRGFCVHCRNAKRSPDVAGECLCLVSANRPCSGDLRAIGGDHRERREPPVRLPRPLCAMAHLDLVALDRRWLRGRRLPLRSIGRAHMDSGRLSRQLRAPRSSSSLAIWPSGRSRHDCAG